MSSEFHIQVRSDGMWLNVTVSPLHSYRIELITKLGETSPWDNIEPCHLGLNFVQPACGYVYKPTRSSHLSLPQPQIHSLILIINEQKKIDLSLTRPHITHQEVCDWVTGYPVSRSPVQMMAWPIVGGTGPCVERVNNHEDLDNEGQKALPDT